MNRTRMLSLSFALILMVLFLLPMNVQAAEVPQVTFTPAPSESITITESSGEMPTLDAGWYLTEEQAVSQLRNYMIERRANCTIYVQSESSDYEAVGSAILAQTFVHDGTPKGGDYLAAHWAGGGAQVDWDYDGTHYLYTFTFELQYTTTYVQENELDGAISSVLSRLNVRNKSDYEKVSAVYNYIRENITYDEVHANDEYYLLKHTAYAALVNKTAVTDGMSSLLYRMLLELGVDNRIILGETSGGVHCWNIVKLDSVYYNTDIAYDVVQSDYSFFLRNTENFPDHYRYLEYDSYEFHVTYPMSATDYVPGVVGEPEQYFVWGVCGDDAYWAIDRNRVLTLFGTGSTWNYSETTNLENSAPWRYWENAIVSVVVEEGITSIGDYFFYAIPNLTSVTLPDTLETFGWGVFRFCTNLSSLRIPDSVVSIGYTTFSDCENLKEVILGSGLETIENYAFSECFALNKINFPEGLKSIGAGAFSSCHALTEITIPASVESLTGFSECNSLTTVNLYNSNVGPYAFHNCHELKNVNFYGPLASIGVAAFQNCTSLSEITIPETLTYFGSTAFAGCTSLEKVTLNNSGVIESYAFSECDSLTELVIGDQVTLIGMCAFDSCNALETVTFPESIESIEGSAFRSCNALKKLIFQGDAPNIDSSAFTYVTATAYYPEMNPTWTEDKFQDYGGTLTWVSNHVHQLADTAPVYDAATRTHKRDCLTCDTDLVEECSFTSATAQEATLTTPGITQYTCSVCGGSYNEEFFCRIFGNNRYETAYSAADMLKSQLGVDKFNTIIVASGLDFADALTGSYLAAVKQAPILLVNQHFMDETAAYINENLASGGKVYLLGGEVAVSPEMEAMIPGIDVERLAGANRLETNLKILEEAGIGDEEILVCYSHGFADSLSASAVGKPILMVNRGLTPAQKEFLATSSGKFVIIGGTTAVSEAIEAQLQEFGTTERIGGANRYETSINVAKRFFAAPQTVVLAYGANFPDGLCGGPLAYSVGAPLILTRDVNAPLADAYTDTYGITYGAVLGGPTLISDDAVNSVFP